jgi:hypothetical protein
MQSDPVTANFTAGAWLVPWVMKRSTCWAVWMVGIGLVSRYFEANRSTLVFNVCMWSYLVVAEGVLDYRVNGPNYRLEEKINAKRKEIERLEAQLSQPGEASQ